MKVQNSKFFVKSHPSKNNDSRKYVKKKITKSIIKRMNDKYIIR